uniref:SET domain-containing protein n=1 Tax=Syphacia muris TaxID=451379 RepID=A0A158R4Z6_9BILA
MAAVNKVIGDPADFKTSTVIPAVVTPSINVQKTSHVVPSTVVKIPYTQKSTKAPDVRNNVLRLPATSGPSQQCETWLPKNTKQVASTSFGSSSQASAVTHMNENCSAPSYVNNINTSTLFFPQIPSSSITQNYSASTPNGSSVEVSLNRSGSSGKYQSNHNPVSESSATPDSGIQSIGDSPRSLGPFVTPMPSPAEFASASSEVNESITESAKFEDFSDMPRLVPYHQIEEQTSTPTCSSNPDEAPQIVDATKSENEETGREEAIPKIAITPSVNVNDLVEQLLSHLGPEQRRQFADVIKSKSVEEFDKVKTVQSPPVLTAATVISEPTSANTVTNKQSSVTDGSVEEETWEAALDEATNQQHSGTVHSQHCEISSYTCDAYSVAKMEDKRWSHEKLENSKKDDEIAVLDNSGQQELCDDEVTATYVCHSRADGSEEETKKKKDEEGRGCRVDGVVNRVDDQGEEEDEDADDGSGNADMMSDVSNRGRLSECSAKERILELDLLDNDEQPAFHENTSNISNDSQSAVFTSVKHDECVDFKEEKKLVRKRRCSLKHEKIQGKKAKLKSTSETYEIFNNDRSVEMVSGTATSSMSQQLEKGKEELSSEDSLLDATPMPVLDAEGVTPVKTNELNDESRERLRCFRQKVKQRMNEQLNEIIKQVAKQFGELELQLGPRMRWDLPWYRLNWKEVAQRYITLAERNQQEKLAREKLIGVTSSKVHNLKKHIVKKATLKDDLPFLESASSSGLYSFEERLTSYKLIKNNVNIDIVPRIEQNICSCKSGSCEESDACSNRLIHMECDTNCPRGKYCSNHRFVKCEYVKLETFEQPLVGCGVGVRTSEPIEKGQFIYEFVGEILSAYSFNKRRKQYEGYNKCFALYLDNGYVVDAFFQGNITRSVDGQPRLGIFALRKINEGEELLLDYSVCSPMFNDMTSMCGFKYTGVAAKVHSSSNGKKKIKGAELRVLMRNFCNDLLVIFRSHGSVLKKPLSALQTSLNSLLSRTSIEKHDQLLLGMIENEIQRFFEVIAKHFERKKFEEMKAKVLVVKLRYVDRLKKYYEEIPPSFTEKPFYNRKKLHTHRILTATTDLSYLDCGVPVGSYDPDNITNLSLAEADSDCVRCICGITDDDGSMVQCDRCHFWLHDDCVYFSEPSKENVEFICDICKFGTKRIPAVDIPLRPQPDIKLAGCTYYRTLVNARNVQVRLNETYKIELKRLTEASKDVHLKTEGLTPILQNSKIVDIDFEASSFSRRDLRCFRVERLFVSPEGHKFVFGSHYARPHEVYCEPGRMFHKNELFATSMFDTLPLDAVVGRCLALEPRVYCLGRPKMPHYDEADVYFYEFQQTARNSRYFDKIPSRNHYYVNTGSHNFIYFPSPLKMERTFSVLLHSLFAFYFVLPFVLSPSGVNNRSLMLDSSSSSVGPVRSIIASPKKNKKNKAARLENLVQKLSAQST